MPSFDWTRAWFPSGAPSIAEPSGRAPAPPSHLEDQPGLIRVMGHLWSRATPSPSETHGRGTALPAAPRSPRRVAAAATRCSAPVTAARSCSTAGRGRPESDDPDRHATARGGRGRRQTAPSRPPQQRRRIGDRHEAHEAHAHSLGCQRMAYRGLERATDLRVRHLATVDHHADRGDRLAQALHPGRLERPPAAPRPAAPQGRQGRRRGGRPAGASEHVPHADVERVGAIFVPREDPGQTLVLIVLEEDDLVPPPAVFRLRENVSTPCPEIRLPTVSRAAVFRRWFVSNARFGVIWKASRPKVCSTARVNGNDSMPTAACCSRDVARLRWLGVLLQGAQFGVTSIGAFGVAAEEQRHDLDPRERRVRGELRIQPIDRAR